MEHVKYYPNIASITYVIEFVKKILIKKNCTDSQKCAMVDLQCGKARFDSGLVNVKVLKYGKVLESWQQ